MPVSARHPQDCVLLRCLYLSAFNAEQLSAYPEPFAVLCHLVEVGHKFVTDTESTQVPARRLNFSMCCCFQCSTA